MVLNICLVGAGRAGEFHVNSINCISNVRITHIVDNNLERAKLLANKVNNDRIVLFDNLERVLEEDLRSQLVDDSIDFVIVATSTHTHYDMIRLAFKYNKHVFCEKPLGTPEQIKECYQMAKDKNLHLLIGFQKRFDKHYQGFCNSVEKDELNQLTFITRDYPLPSIEYLKTSKGIIEDMMSHDIDMTNLIMEGEKPQSVFAVGHTNHPELLKHNEIEHVNVLMYYASGKIVTLIGSRTSTHYDQRAQAYMDKNSVIMDNLTVDTVSVTNNCVMMNSQIEETFLSRYREAYRNELLYFIDMIKWNRENPITCENMLLNAEICRAINLSLEKGEKINLV